MKILIGWCLISLIGTLVALCLIRNGKSPHRSAELDEPPCCDQNPSQAPLPTPLQASKIVQHPSEHLR
jgi:hypothetical protein